MSITTAMRKWLFVAAVMGALAVLFAAFGEHALATRLTPRALATFATGSRYQLMHALAMGLAATPAIADPRPPITAV